MAKKITVRIAQIMKPATASTINLGTTLAGVLKNKGMDYSSAIRVNGVVKSKDYKMKAGDIILVVGSVSAG